MKKILAFSMAALLVAGTAFATTSGTKVKRDEGSFGKLVVEHPSMANAAIDTVIVSISDAAWLLDNQKFGAADTTSAGVEEVDCVLPIFMHAQSATANVDTCSVAIDISPDGQGWTATGGLSATTFVEGTPQHVRLDPTSPAPYIRIRTTNSDATTGVWKIVLSYPNK